MVNPLRLTKKYWDFLVDGSVSLEVMGALLPPTE